LDCSNGRFSRIGRSARIAFPKARNSRKPKLGIERVCCSL
jgi:hypothetical protein